MSKKLNNLSKVKVESAPETDGSDEDEGDISEDKKLYAAQRIEARRIWLIRRIEEIGQLKKTIKVHICLE